MILYTKFGDEGRTQTFSGETYRKNDLLIEVNGSIDEVMVSIETFRIYITDEKILKDIDKIYEAMGMLGAEISSGKTTNLQKYIVQDFVERLERRIDEIFVPLQSFQRFYKSESVSCNEVRVRVRKLERLMTSLLLQKSLRPVTFAYINRLSDYLFALAVHLEKLEIQS